MADDVTDALEDIRNALDALDEDQDEFLIRIAGPLDRLSEIANTSVVEPRAKRRGRKAG